MQDRNGDSRPWWEEGAGRGSRDVGHAWMEAGKDRTDQTRHGSIWGRTWGPGVQQSPSSQSGVGKQVPARSHRLVYLHEPRCHPIRLRRPCSVGMQHGPHRTCLRAESISASAMPCVDRSAAHACSSPTVVYIASLHGPAMSGPYPSGVGEPSRVVFTLSSSRSEAANKSQGGSTPCQDLTSLQLAYVIHTQGLQRCRRWIQGPKTPQIQGLPQLKTVSAFPPFFLSRAGFLTPGPLSFLFHLKFSWGIINTVSTVV
ncbi:hypothetical protein F4679DRAFT_333113 [Xylaria curta]|nr:hypothetical protein F4679DRAFT_333113 [Xylaria curta]